MSTSSQSETQGTQVALSPAEKWLQLLWGYTRLLALVGVLVFVAISWNDLRALIPRISTFEALGVKVEVAQLENALEKQVSAAKNADITIPPGGIEGAVNRALHVQGVFQGANILWIDDHPAYNLFFRQVLRELGAGVEPARSTAEALSLVGIQEFDLVVSDINRGDENGIEGLERLRKAGVSTPAIFYILRVDPNRPVPAGALGITNRVDELLHLVIDGLERSRWSARRDAK